MYALQLHTPPLFDLSAGEEGGRRPSTVAPPLYSGEQTKIPPSPLKYSSGFESELRFFTTIPNRPDRGRLTKTLRPKSNQQ